MSKTKFYFIRHGQTNRNVSGKLPDGLNDPLNERGIQQALETVVNVPFSINIMVSSPFSRAVETGKIVCNALGSKIIISEPDPRLSEVNFGGLKGKTWEEAQILYPGNDLKEQYRNQNYDFSSHGGDSYESVKERVYSFIKDMKEKYPGKEILVATHAGIIRCVYKAENNYVFPDAPTNGSVHIFEF